MEKTIAELDGTLVLNYVEDEIDMLEPIVVQEEPRLDTSFDENQNPKAASKPTISEETPKKDKDLIVLLENKVLSPKKLVLSSDGSKKNDMVSVKVSASEESTGLNPKKVEGNSLGVKRARPTEAVKELDAPEAKRAKAQCIVEDLNDKNSNDPVETKALELPKPKRGRPKGSGANKQKTIKTKIKLKPSLLLLPILGLPKPKRGRPKSLGATKEKVKTKIQPSVLKKNTIFKTKDLGPPNKKRGRPKGVGAKKLNVPLITELQASFPKNSEETRSEQDDCMKSQDLKILKPKKGRLKGPVTKKILKAKQMSQSPPLKLKQAKETALKDKHKDTTVNTKDIGPSKRKRGRPKGFKVKFFWEKFNSVANSIVNKDLDPLQVEESDKSSLGNEQKTTLVTIDLESTSSKPVETIGLEAIEVMPEAKKTPSNAEENVVNDLAVGALNACAEREYLVPPKSRRGRPKKLTTEVNKEVEPSNTKETEKNSLVTEQDVSLVSSNVESSCSKPTETFGLEAKQVITAVTKNDLKASNAEENVVNNLGVRELDASVRSKYLLPPKNKRGRPKSLTKNVTDKNIEPSRTQEIEKSRCTQQGSSLVSNDMDSSNSTVEAIHSGVKQVMSAMTEKELETSNAEEHVARDLGIKAPNDFARSKYLLPPKSRRGRPKSLTKNVTNIDEEISKAEEIEKTSSVTEQEGSSIRNNTDTSSSKPAETKQVISSVAEKELEASSAEEHVASDLCAQASNDFARRNYLLPPKNKRGRPKSFKNVTNKDVDIFKAGEIVKSSLVTEQEGSSVRNDTDSSGSKPVETKQVISSVAEKELEASSAEEHVSSDVYAQASNDFARRNYLLPTKSKRGRPKSLAKNVINKDVEISKAEEVEKSSLVTGQEGPSVRDDTDYSSSKLVKPKQVIPAVDEKILEALSANEHVDGNLSVQASNDLARRKYLLPPKSKRGRPKSVAKNITDKDVGISKAEETEKRSLVTEQKRDSMRNDTDFSSSKPVETKQVKSAVVQKGLEASNVEEHVTSDFGRSKYLLPPKSKRRRPRSVANNVTDKEVEISKTEEIEKSSLVTEQKGYSVRNDPDSSSSKPVETKQVISAVAEKELEGPNAEEHAGELVVKTSNDFARSKYLLPPKNKRGRPRSGVKNVTDKDAEISKAEEIEKRSLVTEQKQDSVRNDTDSTSSKPVETKQVVSAVTEEELEAASAEEHLASDLGVKISNDFASSKYLLPSKTKRGRPKSLTKNITDKDVELSKKIEKGSLVTEQEGSLVRNYTESSSCKPVETKQVIPAVASNLVVKAFNSARTKYLLPPKSKRGRPKGLANKITLASSKTKEIEKNSSATDHDVCLTNSDLDACSSKFVEDVDLEAKQVISSVTKSKLKPSNAEEIAFTDLGVKSFKVFSSKSLLSPKGRRGRPKSLPKKVTFSVMTKNSEDHGTKVPDLGPVKLNYSLENKVLEASKSKTLNGTDLEMKKNISAIGTNKSKSSEPEETEIRDLIAKTLNRAKRSLNIVPHKGKRGRPKSLVTKKAETDVVLINSELAKVREIDIIAAELQQLIVSVEQNDLEPSQSKTKKVKNLEAQKAGSSVATESQSTNSKKVEKKGLENEQQNAAIEIIDLVVPKPTGSNALATSEVVVLLDAVKDLEYPKAKVTETKDKRSNQLNVSGKTTALQLFKSKERTKKCLEMTQQNDVVEIVDVEPPKPKRGRPKGSVPKKSINFVATTHSQSSISKKSGAVIDLELPHPKQTKRQGVGAKKSNILEITENSEILKPELTENANVHIKEIITFTNPGGSNDFKFPKPITVKAVPSGIKRVSAFIPSRETKLAKPEEPDAKSVQVDASGRDSNVEPPKIKETEVQIAERRPTLCTVGTQTIEILDDDDEAMVPEVKSPVRKTSVSSVGTQVLESPKVRGVEIKGLGRKTSGSTVGVVDLEAPIAKNAPEVKKVKAFVGINRSESVLPKGSKVSENKGADEQSDDETVKIEERSFSNDVTNIATVENPELGVKYETLEQIHTEFKYESQSETEEMLKKRRGKHGGPMRGRRRGIRKMEDIKGQTTLDSFIRIVDLNGTVQMKFRNQIFKCDHCLYVGNSKANLDRHSLLHLNPEDIIWFQCTECVYRSKYEHQLKSHFLIHMKPDQIKYFQCPFCEVKCSRKHNLTNHIKSIHADREYSFKCAECDYSTFSKDRLVAHLKKHSKEVHACSLCKFVTKRKEYLESHFKIKHMEEVPRPFPCDTCSYKGKTKRELDRHFDRMHNKEKLHVYQCIHCPFNSIYKKNLEFHLLHMHNNSEGFQKFICGHCQKTFTYKNGLKVHIIRCHIKLPDDDWHKCLECKYRSKDLGTLKRHIKKNHGPPRLQCKQCSFATNRLTSMRAHTKTHEFDNEDIMKCPECPYRSLQFSSFMYHMKVIHGKPISTKEAEQYFMDDD